MYEHLLLMSVSDISLSLSGGQLVGIYSLSDSLPVLVLINVCACECDRCRTIITHAG